MLLEKLICIFAIGVLIVLLTYNFIKKRNINNIFIISELVVCLGIYLPFVIKGRFIPNILQIAIFIAGIVMPTIYTVIQYNNIKILKKILYYNLKKSYNSKNYIKTMELLKK